jgi:hypothetical protein
MAPFLFSKGEKLEMNELLAALKARIRTLQAKNGRERKKIADLTRLSETVETSFENLLLARSRCELLLKKLNQAEHRADETTVKELAPQILAAATERNRLQREFLKLHSRIFRRLRLHVDVTAPGSQSEIS